MYLSANLTYVDFAIDEALYLNDAYSKGLRYNAMVSQAQRICELYLKQVIEHSLTYDPDVCRSHNLRTLYDYIEGLGYDLKEIRSDVMLLNNFYTHTRYPGRDSFLAANEDINSSVLAVNRIVQFISEVI